MTGKEALLKLLTALKEQDRTMYDKIYREFKLWKTVGNNAVKVYKNKINDEEKD